MAQVNKIDSNTVGLAYSEETTLGVLAGSPIWNSLEPNSYNDFGGEVSTVAPNPINPSRSRNKGVITDLDASGGFNHNLTFHNLIDLSQGIMFASLRRKGFETVTGVSIDGGNPDEYEVDDTTGFVVGSMVKGFGFTNASNNSFNIVTAIVANTSVEVATGSLVDEASPPADAYVQVVGFEGSSGDIDVDVSGDLPTLTSSATNFGTMGLKTGQWIFIGAIHQLQDFRIQSITGLNELE